MALACTSVAFSYQSEDPVLRNASLVAQPGRICAVIGASGAGKSTLASCLCGELTPSAGTVSCDGKAAKSPEFSSLIGRVRQRPELQLFAETAYDDVAFGPKNLGLEGKVLEQCVEHALDAMGLDPARARTCSPFAYSGGEKRRLAIAGTLALRPRYLVLDEPTAGLHPQAARSLMNQLKELAAEGVGVVLISHDLNLVLEYAHTAYVLHDGTLFSGESPARAFASEAFTQAGLEPPAVTRLLDALSKRGMAIPPHAWESERNAANALSGLITGETSLEAAPETALEASSEASLGNAPTSSTFKTAPASSSPENEPESNAAEAAPEKQPAAACAQQAGAQQARPQQAYAQQAHTRQTSARQAPARQRPEPTRGRAARGKQAHGKPARTSSQNPFGFGIYREGSSLAHTLDPRAKTMFCLAFLAAAVFAQSAFSLGIVAAACLLMLVASHTSPARAWKAVRPFAPLMVFVVAFDALFTGGNSPVLQLGPLAVTTEGLAFAATSVAKFACALIGASTLMTTTSPTALSDGLALMASPLRRLGARVDDAAFAMGATFRFIPVLTEEFSRIRRAQADRRADFAQGGLVTRVRALAPVLIPLFASALRRADTLAAAVRNRGFGTTPARTCLRAYRMRGRDWLTLAVGLIVLAAAIALR